MIDPTAAVALSTARRAATARDALASAGDENKNALARKVLIERRKEENERALLEAEHKVRGLSTCKVWVFARVGCFLG